MQYSNVVTEKKLSGRRGLRDGPIVDQNLVIAEPLNEKSHLKGLQKVNE